MEEETSEGIPRPVECPECEEIFMRFKVISHLSGVKEYSLTFHNGYLDWTYEDEDFEVDRDEFYCPNCDYNLESIIDSSEEAEEILSNNVKFFEQVSELYHRVIRYRDDIPPDFDFDTLSRMASMSEMGCANSRIDRK